LSYLSEIKEDKLRVEIIKVLIKREI